MSILQYIPGIPRSYWQDYIKTILPTKPLIINPNTLNIPLITAIENKRGLILAFSMESNNPNLEFSLITDNQTITGSYEELYESGYVGYFIPGFPWLSQYNTSANVYVVNLFGELPFQRNVIVTVSNPTSNTVTISAMGFQALIMEEGFYRELAKLKKGEL